ncbi:unnamed protein product [Pedinophyceae sp. YPF-701]|nr:unnamed protein product [Pedinophyceae sp. YPF-701]
MAARDERRPAARAASRRRHACRGPLMLLVVLAMLCVSPAAARIPGGGLRSLLQPPPMGGMNGGGPNAPAYTQPSGSQSSSSCAVTSGSCAEDGSSNSFDGGNLAWSNGRFQGSLLTNQCPHYTYSNGRPSASCQTHQIPDPSFANGASGAPLLGVVGYSYVSATTGGMPIYGPFEAGFSEGQACTNGRGSCPAGMDVPTCEAKLVHECGQSNVAQGMLPDSCGAHASPYHFHHGMDCLDRSSTGHSSLVGVALDGFGIYAKNEDTNAKPTDLDACGGHIGVAPSPDGSTNGTFYHYHIQEQGPFTLGCYSGGQPKTVSECKALQTEACDGTRGTYTTSEGSIEYDLWCPCYESGQAPRLEGGAQPSSTSATTAPPSGATQAPATNAPGSTQAPQATTPPPAPTQAPPQQATISVSFTATFNSASDDGSLNDDERSRIVAAVLVSMGSPSGAEVVSSSFTRISKRRSLRGLGSYSVDVEVRTNSVASATVAADATTDASLLAAFLAQGVQASAVSSTRASASAASTGGGGSAAGAAGMSALAVVAAGVALLLP